MLWIEPIEMIYCAGFGGLIGGCIACIANRSTAKFNSDMLKNYWQSSNELTRARMKILEDKLFKIEKSLAVNCQGKDVSTPVEMQSHQHKKKKNKNG